MEVLNPPPRTFWEDIVKACENATFYHTPTWVGILEKTYPRYRNATRGFTFTTGNRAVFPLVAEHSSGFLVKNVKHKSMALGVYGGVLAERGLTTGEANALLEHITNTDITDLKVVENPLAPCTFPGNFMSKPLFTHILHLESDFNHVFSGFSRGQKSNIKQARKKGVTVRCADTRTDYENYYLMYLETIKRWGEKAHSVHPMALFANLFDARTPDIRLWLAEKDGTIIAGVIALYCNRNILYWHGCSLHNYFDHYPNNLLHAEIIKDGCLRGYGVYDLNPSGGHEGVIQFKKSFSAQRIDFRAFHWKHKRLPLRKRASRQRMPLAGSTLPGREKNNEQI